MLDNQSLSTCWNLSGFTNAIASAVPAPFETAGLLPDSFRRSDPWDWNILAILLLLAPFILTYPVTLWKSKVALRVHEDGKQPALVPYWIPLVGHVLSYLLDAARLASSITYVTLKPFSTSVPELTGDSGQTSVPRPLFGCDSSTRMYM